MYVYVYVCEYVSVRVRRILFKTVAYIRVMFNRNKIYGKKNYTEVIDKYAWSGPDVREINGPVDLSVG